MRSLREGGRRLGCCGGFVRSWTSAPATINGGGGRGTPNATSHANLQPPGLDTLSCVWRPWSPDQRPQMSESAVVDGTRITMGLLRRLDVVIAATLCGSAVASISSACWCAESSCRSLPDAARFYGLGIATIGIAAAAFWHIRRWPLRIVVLVAALYASYLIPRWTERHGRWTVHLDSRSCAVHAGVTRGEIRRKCGGPSYICHG